MATPPADVVPLDIVSASIAMIVATGLAGGQAAALIGPYLVIGAASALGSFVSITRLPQGFGVTRQVGIFSLTCVGAAMMAGSLADMASQALVHVGLHMESRYLLAPVSGAISAIGHDWPDLIAKTWARVSSAAIKRFGVSND